MTDIDLSVVSGVGIQLWARSIAADGTLQQMTGMAVATAIGSIFGFLALAWVFRTALCKRSLRHFTDALGKIASANAVAMIAWDGSGCVLLWSDGAEKLLGIERTRALGLPLPGGLADLRQMQVDDASQQPVLLRRPESGDLSASLLRIDVCGASRLHVATIRDLSVFRSEADWEDASRLQRDALIREVHHRIKNSLQGVAGLLRQHLADKPLLRPLLEAASAQVCAIAAVHGLQGEASGGLVNLRTLVARVAASVSGIMHSPIVLSERCASLAAYNVKEEESVSVALVLNELVMNAAKHRVRGSGAIKIDTVEVENGVELRIRNPGFLPANFDTAVLSRAGNGLALACSLLPRRGARIALSEDGDDVLTTMTLREPDVLNMQPRQPGKMA